MDDDDYRRPTRVWLFRLQSQMLSLFAVATRTSKFIIVSIIQITHARLQSLANESGLRCRRRLYPAWIRAIATTKTVVLLASVEAATSKVSSLETIAVCSS